MAKKEKRAGSIGSSHGVRCCGWTTGRRRRRLIRVYLLLAQIQEVGQMQNRDDAGYVVGHVLLFHGPQLGSDRVVDPVGGFARQLADRLDGVQHFVLIRRHWSCKIGKNFFLSIILWFHVQIYIIILFMY